MDIDKITEDIEKIKQELEKLVPGNDQDINSDEQEGLAQKLLRFLNSNIELIETFVRLIDAFAKKTSSISNDIDLLGIDRGWYELRNTAERMQRRLTLLKPTNQQEFEATLMWMSEKGKEEELILIQKIKKNPPYSSEAIQYLFKIASNKIEDRLRKQGTELGRYRIFCTESEVDNFSKKIHVIQSYPAFTVVLALNDTIFELGKCYHIERLPSDHLKPEMATEPPEITALKEKIREVQMSNQVVRFNAPVLESWKRRIEEIGAKILQPLGGSQFVVSVPPDKGVINEIRNLEEVDSVTPYKPKIEVNRQHLEILGKEVTEEEIREAKLKAANQNPPSFLEPNITLPGILIATFFTEEDRDRAASNLEFQEIKILDKPGTTQLVIDLTSHSDAVNAVDNMIAKQVGLRILEEETIPTLLNDLARETIGKGVVHSNPHPTLGDISLTGKGEIVAVADTGLDTGDTATLHLDFQERVRKIKSYPIQQLYSSKILNAGDDDGPSDKYSGHGTHVTGSILGNGEQAKKFNLPSIQGIAPEAELIFQAVEQTIKWTEQYSNLFKKLYGTNPPPSQLYGLPKDLKELFEFAYKNRARIHSDSWCTGKQVNSLNVDEFVWSHKNFLIVIAAGNSGKQNLSKVIKLGNIVHPATAKNCLTVGASENNRASQFADTYGNCFPESFPYEPLKSDCMADSIDDIVAFSSRGPCQDGRRKPDVIAPGTFILSTRSSQIPNNNFAWGYYPPAKHYYMYNGGTSMATPLVAGCAALVRQYLREERGISNPSAALVKAALIHSAEYINYRFAHPSSSPWADDEQGWGRINLKRVLNPGSSIQVHFVDESQGLMTGDKREYEVEINDNSVPLRATLVYTDYPGEELINNLNLFIDSPSGKRYFGNDFEGNNSSDSVNNVEGVIVKSPELGIWKLQIVGSEVLQESQDYALVISGAVTDFKPVD